MCFINFWFARRLQSHFLLLLIHNFLRRCLLIVPLYALPQESSTRCKLEQMRSGAWAQSWAGGICSVRGAEQAGAGSTFWARTSDLWSGTASLANLSCGRVPQVWLEMAVLINFSQVFALAQQKAVRGAPRRERMWPIPPAHTVHTSTYVFPALHLQYTRRPMHLFSKEPLSVFPIFITSLHVIHYTYTQ